MFWRFSRFFRRFSSQPLFSGTSKKPKKARTFGALLDSIESVLNAVEGLCCIGPPVTTNCNANSKCHFVFASYVGHIPEMANALSVQHGLLTVSFCPICITPKSILSHNTALTPLTLREVENALSIFHNSHSAVWWQAATDELLRHLAPAVFSKKLLIYLHYQISFSQYFLLNQYTSFLSLWQDAKRILFKETTRCRVVNNCVFWQRPEEHFHSVRRKISLSTFCFWSQLRLNPESMCKRWTFQVLQPEWSGWYVSGGLTSGIAKGP